MMEAQLTDVAERCLDAAYDGTMSFPEIVSTLLAAGFEGYLVDYRQNTATYYHSAKGSVILENRPSAEMVASDFDADTVAAQIRWAQANPPEYSYAAFCKNVKAAGCAGYIVSFQGRRVVYFGRTAEMHVEYFPE